jgi:hypothetical protein
MTLPPPSLEFTIGFFGFLILLLAVYDIWSMPRPKPIAALPPEEDLAERCPECERVTYGFDGSFKWCCYCGARLPGTYVRIERPKIIEDLKSGEEQCE